MVPFWKKKLQKRRLLSQLDDFDQGANFGDPANRGQQNVVVKTVLLTKNLLPPMVAMFQQSMRKVMVQTSERCFIETIGTEGVRLLTQLKIGSRQRH